MAPVITAPAAFSTEATAVDTPLTSADYGLATATDDTDPNPAITSDAPATFPLGDTTITWTATDANGLIATAQQTVTIVNAPPVGVSDVYTIDEDNILTVSDYASGVLGNDIDPNNPIIASADLVSDTVNGILLLNPDGTFEYDPDDDFFGTDTFTYIPNDGFLVGSETSVTINVQPINDVPVAGDSTVATDLNAGVEILLTGSDIDGDVLGLNLVSLPSNGAITEIIEVSSNSISLKYTPNVGFIGIDSFDYAFIDAESQSNTATVTVLVVNTLAGGGSGGGSAFAPMFTGKYFEDSDKIPLVIDGKSYDLPAFENDIKLHTIDTGEKISFTFTLFENSGGKNVEHFEFLTNLTEKSREYDDSDTRIIYDKNEELIIQDPNGLFSDVTFDMLYDDSNTNFEAVVELDLTFAKAMPTSDIYLRIWDAQKNSRDVILNNVIKVIGDEVTPPNFDGETVEELIAKTADNTINLNDTVSIPVWVKSSAGW